jgi:hypothetical protein
LGGFLEPDLRKRLAAAPMSTAAKDGVQADLGGKPVPAGRSMERHAGHLPIKHTTVRSPMPSEVQPKTMCHSKTGG